MSLFEIDFLNQMGVILKEAFKFKKYKAMHPALAVFTGLLMLPFVIASFLVTVVFAVLGFAFTVIKSPARYLHDVVHGEGQSVKHATQTAIYLISWPTVFFSYVMMSIMLVMLMPTYALLSILLYVWSLGGFKFHLFPNKGGDISIDVDGTYRVLPVVYVVIGLLLVIFIPLVHGIIQYASLYENYLERLFFQVFFGGIYPIYISIHIAFSFLYSLIAFARPPKKIKAANTEEI